MMAKASTIVEVNNLTYQYTDRPVLQNLNLSIEEGSFLGLVGPNGSGKSTLIKCILGLIKPQAGKLSLFGSELHRLMIGQKSATFLNVRIDSMQAFQQLFLKLFQWVYLANSVYSAL